METVELWSGISAVVAVVLTGGTIGAGISAFCYNWKLKKLQDENKELTIRLQESSGKDNKPLFFISCYKTSEDTILQRDIEERIENAKNKITMVGWCLNILWKPEIRDKLNKSKVDIELCMSNPMSPYVEYCNDFISSKIGPKIVADKESIVGIYDSLKESIREKFKLFDYTPSFGLIIVDNDIFIYPYGYKILGTQSPMFHLLNDNTEKSLFFIDSARNIIEGSFPAKKNS